MSEPYHEMAQRFGAYQPSRDPDRRAFVDRHIDESMGRQDRPGGRGWDEFTITRTVRLADEAYDRSVSRAAHPSNPVSPADRALADLHAALAAVGLPQTATLAELISHHRANAGTAVALETAGIIANLEAELSGARTNDGENNHA